MRGWDMVPVQRCSPRLRLGTTSFAAFSGPFTAAWHEARFAQLRRDSPNGAARHAQRDLNDAQAQDCQSSEELSDSFTFAEVSWLMDLKFLFVMSHAWCRIFKLGVL